MVNKLADDAPFFRSCSPEHKSIAPIASSTLHGQQFGDLNYLARAIFQAVLLHNQVNRGADQLQLQHEVRSFGITPHASRAHTSSEWGRANAFQRRFEGRPSTGPTSSAPLPKLVSLRQ